MLKALKLNPGKHITIALSVMVILISIAGWGRLFVQNTSSDIALIDKADRLANTAQTSATSQSRTKFKGQYIISGVITAVVNYLPFKSEDK